MQIVFDWEIPKLGPIFGTRVVIQDLDPQGTLKLKLKFNGFQGQG